ncbi:DUF2062 domain-containing protein [Parahaliea maris]|uniref:DUF2062 domain-containing protein n=1 Tax=Parahaliea maris TaxID=2716870 RepID=A0A5C8ZWV6_9GAMM|nr:DUF2062 domain-containing protein [Parahaliea maris]TXS92995.1 DUF2062 domain-containing protein [Parahaliea maris]
MPKHTLKQIMPSPARLREIKALGFLGEWIYQSNLWHLNRYSASMAFFIGLFVAFVPLPGQMVIAALLAILVRCNLPLAVTLIWITNPLTIPAIFYLAYRVGALLMNEPVQFMHFQLSLEWATESLHVIWQPFLLGCLVCGLFFGSVGYFVISMLWRWHVANRWHARKARRLTAKKLLEENRPGQ